MLLIMGKTFVVLMQQYVKLSCDRDNSLSVVLAHKLLSLMIIIIKIIIIIIIIIIIKTIIHFVIARPLSRH